MIDLLKEIEGLFIPDMVLLKHTADSWVLTPQNSTDTGGYSGIQLG